MTRARPYELDTADELQECARNLLGLFEAQRCFFYPYESTMRRLEAAMKAFRDEVAVQRVPADYGVSVSISAPR